MKFIKSLNPLGRKLLFFVALLISTMILCPYAQATNEEFEIINNVLIKYNGSENEVRIPDGVTIIGEKAFEYCTCERIIIPQSVTQIDDHAFEFCENLTSVSIPNSVTKIGNWVFSYCTSLKAIVLPDSITSMGIATFDCCSSLEYAHLPAHIQVLPAYTFSFCESLVSVDLPTDIIYVEIQVFFECNSMRSITIPQSVICIMSKAFSRCARLTDLYIEGNNPEFYFMDADLFKASYSFGTIHTNNAFVLQWAAENSIKTDNKPSPSSDILHLPSDLTVINTEAFSGANAAVIIVPASVLRIEPSAFANNNNLQVVIIQNPNTEYDDSIITGSPNASIVHP